MAKPKKTLGQVAFEAHLRELCKASNMPDIENWITCQWNADLNEYGRESWEKAAEAAVWEYSMRYLPYWLEIIEAAKEGQTVRERLLIAVDALLNMEDR